MEDFDAVLSARGGKFLGRWGPAETCACWCGRKLPLTKALWLLAGVQMLTGLSAAFGAISSAVENQSQK